MAGRAGADLVITHPLRRAAAIADLDIDNARQTSEIGFNAPETAGAENRLLPVPRIPHSLKLPPIPIDALLSNNA